MSGEARGAGRPGVFLDRDGTIIVDQDYPGDPGGVVLLPGAAEAIADFNAAGLPVVVITNQSGIGRGYITEADFRAVQARMEELLRDAGARVDATYHCPHAPTQSPPCQCRKPAPGLYLRAAREHGLDPAASFFVGDRLRDVVPGLELGGSTFLIAGTEPAATDAPPPDVRVVQSLAEAAPLVLGRDPRD